MNQNKSISSFLLYNEIKDRCNDASSDENDQTLDIPARVRKPVFSPVKAELRTLVEV